MKKIVLLIGCITFALNVQALDIQVDDQTYTNCKMMSVSASGVSYMHSKGVACIKIEDLPKSEADKYAQQVVAVNKNTNEQKQVEVDRQRKQGRSDDEQKQDTPAKYSIESKSYAGINKSDVVFRVRITNPKFPSEGQIRDVALSVMSMDLNGEDNNKTRSVFVYIDDMPITMAAIAVAEGKNGSLMNFRLQPEWYETWTIMKNQRN